MIDQTAMFLMMQNHESWNCCQQILNIKLVYWICCLQIAFSFFGKLVKTELIFSLRLVSGFVHSCDGNGRSGEARVLWRRHRNLLCSGRSYGFRSGILAARLENRHHHCNSPSIRVSIVLASSARIYKVILFYIIVFLLTFFKFWCLLSIINDLYKNCLIVLNFHNTIFSMNLHY